MVLLMTAIQALVGQASYPSVVTKIKEIRKWADEFHPALEIEVDGGINPQTIAVCAEAEQMYLWPDQPFTIKAIVKKQLNILKQRLSVESRVAALLERGPYENLVLCWRTDTLPSSPGRCPYGCSYMGRGGQGGIHPPGIGDGASCRFR